MAGDVDHWHHRARAQVLEPRLAGQRIEIHRWDPPAPLADVVDYLWAVAWDTPEPYRQQVIPRPVVHVAAESWRDRPRLVVTGPRSGPFHRDLTGRGRTVAVAFRPGGFRPFLDGDVVDLHDREAPLAEVLDADDAPTAQRLLDPSIVLDDAVAVLAGFLEHLDRADDPMVDEVAGLVERAERDQTITRATQLAELAGVTPRTLERRFRAYIGVGPKQVVQRSRLLDVAAAAHQGRPVDWAGLAARLGYADQSHLIRTFTALVGSPPARYAATQIPGSRSAPPG